MSSIHTTPFAGVSDPATQASAQSIPPWETLLAVMAQLRHPTAGCPWDLKQTHASLKKYLLEESHETLDAIDAVTTQPTAETITAFKDELGDVLLQVVLHAQLATEAGWFTADEVVQNLTEKMIRRHPHVFSNTDNTIDSADAVKAQWSDIKAAEKGETQATTSVLDGISKHLPALMQTTQLSRKAVKVGFAWPNDDSLWECVMSEVAEFKAETVEKDPSRMEDELGDIFFAFTSLANHYGLDAETALHRANTKFTQRFTVMEQLVATTMPNRSLQSLSTTEWDDLWKAAKQQLACNKTTTK
ncbi:MAG: nucleoside triphosphate pyrophosphohydrolase [Vampirovibrionales bacterium]|nr:nucleoside triphosphate pyrophosphohydrolase [Vampirovibrionales bacterium]